MGRLNNKVSIVTGSSSGLGRAIALEYSKEGAFVVCADLRPNARPEIPEESVINTHDLINQTKGRAIFVTVDVGIAEQVEALVKAAVWEFGRVDMYHSSTQTPIPELMSAFRLVNNAGVSLEAGKPPARIHETSEDVWDLTMKVNAKSVFLGCKYAIAQMLQQGPHSSGDRGWIINMSSVYGLVGGTFTCSYAASKGAVSNLTRQIAVDYGEAKIHCNAICPGYTKTAIFVNTINTSDSSHAHDTLQAQHPLKGIGQVEDIVGAAVFLASPDASWITGVCLPVDGGFTAR
ncbi:hypothetical protein HYALB_00005795 [Hymenoscyphus albidus]|uniref:NAD(P)-binding protein n=1 Tax=Hymenoscyphus albidus TaxID=595503 RepID=A0A9N9LFN3_9HELO|nr:hypothetical protein HYALB_00005795 [Hymenoscyphus albidus]